MAETLYELLNRCTVRIVVPATQEQGTGFFVAPAQVVTCAHVVKGVAPDMPVQLFWRAQQDQLFQELRAQVRLCADAQDVALLGVESPLDHPCAWLAEESAPFQELYSFGYPQHLAAGGTSVRFTCEGWTERDEQTLLTLTDGQVVPGMSGAPVLSRQTGQVCGLLAITRDQGSNLGGRAILTRTLWQVIPTLQAAQATWKQQDQRWRICLEAHRQSLRQSTIGDGTGGQASRPRDYLPLPPTPLFQERPGEFAELERLLFGQNQPARLGLVGVVGMGGVGKTQLAVELAVRYRERFPDGIFWMPATGQTLYEWQRQLALLAERTEYLPPDDTPGQPDTELRRAKHFATYLAEHAGALLILDNVEQPALVSSALPTLSGNPQPACILLYTSRVPVKPDERVSLHRVETLLPEAALRLLLAEARPAVLEAALTDSQSGEARAARDLCQMVGFLPLGLIHLRRLLARTPTLTLTRLVEGVHGRGALEIAKYEYTDAKSLFATFLLSWEQVQDPRARQLFYLAGYFPEATPIPLWLLGLAAGLGEHPNPWEPLGEACQMLYELSLLELLEEGQARLHPLVREFARRLAADWRDQGNGLVQQVGERLVTNFWHLTRLEQRARRAGYWGCLEQVRAAASYAALLGADQEGQLARLDRWLDWESHLLGQETRWPEQLPGLFYQQMANRAVEEGQPAPEGKVPAQWVRLLAPIGTEDRALLRIFRGHQSGVTSVACSPDGHKVLTGSMDGTARLWEAASGRELASLEGHRDQVWSVAFSPDGSQVLTGSWDQTARIWDAASGRELAMLAGHQRIVTSVAFSPDGTCALTGSADGTARIWDAASGRELATLVGHNGRVTSVAFSPDGTRVLTGSVDKTARLWEVASGRELATLVGHRSKVTSVAFSPDGARILTGLVDGTVRLWETTSGHLLATLKGHQSRVTSVAFSPDGARILTSSVDGTVRLRDVASEHLHAALWGHQGRVMSVAFSPDGARILTGSDDGTARLWETVSRQPLVSLADYRRGVTSVAFSPDGVRILSGSRDGIARLRDVSSVSSGHVLARLEGHESIVTSVAFSLDGQNILTGSCDGTARVWEATSGRLRVRLVGHHGEVTSGAFSPDGARALTGSADGSARVWEVSSGHPLARLEDQQGIVTCVAFSPDGVRALTGSRDGIVRIWEATSGRLLAMLKGHQSIVTCVVFSPDGRRILTGSQDRTARIWEASSGHLLARLADHQSVVASVAFSPDGQLLISCDDKGRVYYWKCQELLEDRPVAIYLAAYEVKAIHWQDRQHLLLVDTGGPINKPNIYRLKLEGL